jgi:hypothetical protein
MSKLDEIVADFKMNPKGRMRSIIQNGTTPEEK